MKEQLTKLALRVDALTLRERMMLFAAVAAVLVFLAWFFGLGPMFARQEALRARIVQQQNNIEGVDNEIAATVRAAQVDPDAPTRQRIAELNARVEQRSASLRAMQSGLAAPERMAPLLNAILRANGRLELVSMRTLPAEPILGAAKPAPAPAAPDSAAPAPETLPNAGAPAAELLYRHGVEVTVRGSYLDMVGYMAALEAMPTQLFWGRAQLDAEVYPASRLTLTLYTLSLDPKWMKL